MAAPSPTDLDALRRLAQRPEGRLIVRVFQSRLAELDRTNRRAIGENLIRGQGRALELEEILSEVFGVSEPRALPDLQPKGKQPGPQPTRPALQRYRVNHMAVD